MSALLHELAGVRLGNTHVLKTHPTYKVSSLYKGDPVNSSWAREVCPVEAPASSFDVTISEHFSTGYIKIQVTVALHD